MQNENTECKHTHSIVVLDPWQPNWQTHTTRALLCPFLGQWTRKISAYLGLLTLSSACVWRFVSQPLVFLRV